MERVVAFTLKAKEDLDYFKTSGQTGILKKIRQIIEALPAAPYAGIGKPEPLKYGMSGLWSRRINQEHRLVYEVGETIIPIYSAKGHYE